MSHSTDFFEHKAESFDNNRPHLESIEKISNAIVNAVQLQPSMHIMDFGSGTGLLLERLAPHVKKVTAVDVSPSMNKVLEGKRDKLACELEILPIDLSTAELEDRYDGIVSSMTMHHIENVEQMFHQLYKFVKPGGFVAIADLDKEDGTFHKKEELGVYHHGFERDLMARAASDAGFQSISLETASHVAKDYGNYPIFLLTGWRKD